MPCDDCSRTESCPPCVNEMGSADSSQNEACQYPDNEACDRRLMGRAYYIKCGCGHVQGEHRTFEAGGCTNCRCKSFNLPPAEPPMTPEEEEEAPEDEPIDTGIDTPQQPQRRPPYAVAYSVQGHLYEVALSGDATVRAVDGALVITHHLGPVAGVVQVRPMNTEGGADGAETDQ